MEVLVISGHKALQILAAHIHILGDFWFVNSTFMTSTAHQPSA